MSSQDQRHDRPRRPKFRWLSGIVVFLILAFATVTLIEERSAASPAATVPPLITRLVIPTTTQSALAQITPTIPATDTLAPTWTPTHTQIPPTPTLTNTATRAPVTFEPTGTLIPTLVNPNGTLPTLTPSPTALPTPQGTISFTVKVPILMYHYISTPPADADAIRIDLSVEPANFRAQMQYLHDNGFTPIDFYQLSRAIAGHEELPERPVIITIDDGYLDAYTEAFPILQEFGFTATIFVITEFVDFNYPAYVTWDMVIEMSQAGIRIEPHTKTHEDIRNRDHAYLIYQLLGSAESVAARVGYQPRYFAYPAGHYDQAVIDVLVELGYWGAVTTVPGKWHGYERRFEWTRLRIRYNTPIPEFASLVGPGDARYGKPPGIAPTPTP